MSGGAPPDLLGKDEVASSNLASSSKKQEQVERLALVFCVCVRKDTTSFDRLRSTSFQASLEHHL